MQWTERETLDTAIPTIELAYEGLIEKLRLVQLGSFGPAAAVSNEANEEYRPSAEKVFSIFRLAANRPRQ